MSNLKKFLKFMLEAGGEKIVFASGEHVYIERDGQKVKISKNVLREHEISYLENELEKDFGTGSEINIENVALSVSKNPDEMVFALNGESEKAVSPLPDIEKLLQEIKIRKGSDLHLSTGCVPNMRIDGDIVPLSEFAEVDSPWLKEQLKKITPSENQTEFFKTMDTDFAYEIEGVARFRANLFQDHRGPGAVFRIIPNDILSAEFLQVPQAVVDLCEAPKGLILVTGPTGSGKSTTLAALIDHINRIQKKHIIIIEDPVEFVHRNRMSLINQREIHTHTGSFKKALRAALREDPDVILVGEMRDLETIAIAIEMAVTGHLVFGTLHTSTAIATVDRIIDQFPSDQQSQIRTMLADALVGVVSQTLLKRKKGGRVAAYEVLIATRGVSNLIREGKNFQIATLMQTGKAAGMQMINSHLGELVKEDLVDPGEALVKAIDKNHLKTVLQAMGKLPESLKSSG